MRDRLLIQALHAVWALAPQTYSALCGMIMRHATGEPISEAELESISAARSSRRTSETVETPYQSYGSVAIIPVTGVLVPYSNMVNGESQRRGTSYEAIKQALASAQNDSQVGVRMLLIDSPGGQLDGLVSVSDAIYQARSMPGAKPIVAHVTGMMASAAFFIGSQASKITAESIGESIGSVGVRTARADYTKSAEAEGIAVHSLATAEAKDDYFPYKPMTDAERGRIMSDLNDGLRLFKQALIRGRSVDAAIVDGWADARMHHAEMALQLRMIDAIMPMDAVLAQLNATYPATGTRVQASGISGHAAVAGSAAASLETQGTEIMHHLKRGFGAPRLTLDGGTGGGGGGSAGGTTVNGNGQTDSGAKREPSTFDAEAAVKADRARIHSIRARAARYDGNPRVKALVDKAISDGTSADGFSTQLLDVLQDDNKPVGGTQTTIEMGTEDREKKASARGLALLARLTPGLESSLRSDRADAVATGMGYANAAAALKDMNEVRRSGMQRVSIKGMMQSCLLAAGISTDAMDPDQMVSAAHSRSDFPSIFSNEMNRSLAARAAAREPIWRRLARKGVAKDFRDRKLVSLSDIGDFKQIKKNKNPEEVSQSDRHEIASLDTHGLRISLSREMIIDDDLGAFAAKMDFISRRAADKPDRLLAELLNANAGLGRQLADGKTLFHADHKNISTSPGAISSESLEEGRQAMALQTGFGEGADMIIPRYPKMIVVPSQLFGEAEQFYINEMDPDADVDVAHRRNRHARKYAPVELPYLASTTAWYLAADPLDDPAIEISFLDGREIPIVSQLTNGSILKLEWEAIFDCRADPIAAEPWFRNAG